jgi:hypothetical protein
MELTLGVDRFRVLESGIAGSTEIPNLFRQLRDKSHFLEVPKDAFEALTTLRDVKGKQVKVDVHVTNMALLVERLRLFFQECQYCQKQAHAEVEQLKLQLVPPGPDAKMAQKIFDANASTKFQPSIWAAVATKVFAFGRCIFRLDTLYLDDIEDGAFNSGRWRSKGKSVSMYTTQMEAVAAWIAARPQQPKDVTNAAIAVVSAVQQWKEEFVAQRSAVIQTLQHLHRVHFSTRARAAPSMLHRHRAMIAARAKGVQRTNNDFLRLGQTQQPLPAAAAAAAVEEAEPAALRKHPPAWEHDIDDSEGQNGIEQQLHHKVAVAETSLKKAKDDCKTASQLASRLQELQQPVECVICKENICQGATQPSLDQPASPGVGAHLSSFSSKVAVCRAPN